VSPAHTELWSRLAAFDPDEPDAAFPFSHRLAREQNWSPNHTRRVIAEYRRFLFLAMTAGHPVSPSEAVDQTWHLHLIYTRSYWDHLCGEVLRQSFHHQPTRGGTRERAKFHDWYARTLASYHTIFGEPPPADIWPAPDHPRPSAVFRRIDLRRHWVIPRPRFRLGKHLIPLAAVSGLLLIAGCQGGTFPGAALFDLRGPEFLKFYLVAFPLCALLAAGLRWWWRQPAAGDMAADPQDIDPYVVAHLVGRAHRVAVVALTQLAAVGAVRIDNPFGVVKITRLGPLPEKAHPLETYLYENLPPTGAATLLKTARRLRPACKPLEDELVTRGWIPTPSNRARARWIPLLIAATPVVLGLIKIDVGLSRGKPVGFLVVFCVISLVAVLIGFGRMPWRSRLGDIWLKRSRDTLQNLRWSPSTQERRELILAIGLFGAGVLAHTALAGVGEKLLPQDNAYSGGGDGGSSSCGGGGDGGGGSGCGGCGGGSSGD
jgi:uncharacterized protein (TIGR04222 family)